MSTDDLSGTAAEQSPSTTFTTFTTDSRTSSQRSSFSSSDSPASTVTAAAATATTTTNVEQAHRSQAQVDVLLRKFPRPTEELDLDALLARPAPKLSLRRYVETWREVRVPATDKEAQTKAFLEAKRELLQSAARGEGPAQSVKERRSA